MDVVYCNGEAEPRIVIKQVNEMVTMVKTADSNEVGNASRYRYGANLKTTQPGMLKKAGPGMQGRRQERPPREGCRVRQWGIDSGRCTVGGHG
jgi:hypothetical protein